MSPADDHPVDLDRVRRALDRLDRLRAEHPEHFAAGLPTADDVEALALDLEEGMAEKKNERIGLRVNPELRERIESYRERVAATLPSGVRLTLSDAARILIEKGLEAEDG